MHLSYFVPLLYERKNDIEICEKDYDQVRRIDRVKTKKFVNVVHPQAK